MNNKICFFVTLPHWVLFLALIIPVLIGTVNPFGNLLFGLVVLAWLLLVRLALRAKIPDNIKKSERWFAFNIIYAFIFILIKTIFWVDISSYLIPFYLAAVYSFFYVIYFVSKSLVVAEEKRLQSFDRYFGTFFLFWFSPIGIWFIQPRIRKILKE
jgi:hypothetical protein